VAVKRDNPEVDSSDDLCEDSQLRIVVELAVYSDPQFFHGLDIPVVVVWSGLVPHVWGG
jgi:hypothetical protein